MEDRHALRRRMLALWLIHAMLSASINAVVIDVVPVHRLVSPPSPHEVLEQLWTGMQSTPGETVQQIQIDTFCQVYVSYQPAPATQDPSHQELLTVRVSGSDFKLITAVDVLPVAQGIKIQQRNETTLRALDGFVGIEVTLYQPATLIDLQVNGSGEVVVEENVLVSDNQNADVRIESSGSGTVFLPQATSLSVNSLSIIARGAGSIYVPSSGSITAPHMTFVSEVAGGVAMTTKTVRATVNITALSSGTGYVCIEADDVETRVMNVTQLGSGNLSIGHDGKSDAALCYQTGSGSIDLGTIQCIDVDVQLHGSGNVTVESARSLSGHDYGTGQIMYAGEMPGDVAAIDPWAYTTYPIASHNLNYQPTKCVTPTAPPRALTRIYKSAAVSSNSFFTPLHVSLLVIFLVIVGAVYLFETRRQRLARRRRDERTPLLEKRDTPVYTPA